ncbi:MAG TPA: ribosome maturation factor RimP [Sandaracinaceae bacterium LLY-WYZ-13_1]|nr:ribosome maturation factor RimP [Sandaracinaceae bacterium LLY-WYZ-13_1]
MATRKESEIETIVEPVCRAHGVELVQVVKASERGGAVLRVVIDRPGNLGEPGQGVTLADCQSVSRDLGPALEVHDAIGGSYRLEVSSPGVERPLVKLRDFERFAGKEIKVKMFAPQPDEKGGKRRKFQGTLLGVDDESVRLEVEGSELQLPHSGIAKAHVVYRFD